MFLDDEFKTTVETHLLCGSVPMLYGEPGIGKSSWVEEVAHDMKANYFCLACNQLAAKEDLTGARLVPVKRKDGTETYAQKFYPHVVLQKAIAAAEDDPNTPVLLFLDEINRTTPDVTSALLSIPTMRSIGDWDLPSNIMIIIAGNDHGNVTALDEASVSRFITFHVEPSLETFLRVNPDLNKYIDQVLRANPELLFCKQIADKPVDTDDDDDSANDGGLSYLDMIDDEGQAQFTTPRTISAASRFLNKLDDTRLLNWSTETYMTQRGKVETSRLQENLEGICGHTQFTLELIKVIADDLIKVVSPTNTIGINKPAEFDKLMSSPDYTTLENTIASMSDAAKSHNLLWALYDKKDCSLVIASLAGALAHFESADAKTLNLGVAQDAFNPDNLQAFTGSGTQLGNMYAIALGL